MDRRPICGGVPPPLRWCPLCGAARIVLAVVVVPRHCQQQTRRASHHHHDVYVGDTRPLSWDIIGLLREAARCKAPSFIALHGHAWRAHCGLVRSFVEQGQLFLGVHGGTVQAAWQAEKGRRIGCDPKLFELDDDRTLMYNILLHLSDVSNPAKPVNIAAKWCETLNPRGWAAPVSRR